MSIQAELRKLTPTARIDMFVLDAGSQGGPTYYFHAGVNKQYGPLVWQGQVYTAIPMRTDDFESRSNGALPVPRITLANPQYLMGAAAREFNNFAGCKIIRKRTFARYLDAINFPDGPDAVSNPIFANGTAAGWTYSDEYAADGENTLSLDFLAADYKVGQPRDAGIPTLDLDLMSDRGRMVRASYTPDVLNVASQPESFFRDFSGVTNCLRLYSKEGLIGDAIPVEFGQVVRVRSQVAAVSTTLRLFLRFTLAGGALQETSVSVVAPAAAVVQIDTMTAVPAGATQAQLFYRQDVADFNTENGNSCITDTHSQVVVNREADPNQHLADEIWFIDRKSHEDRDQIEFELVSALDLRGVKLPRRQIIASTCPSLYRGVECGYTGGPVADEDNVPTSDPNQDQCSKTRGGCRMRFPAPQPLPFGGFPGAGLIR